MKREEIRNLLECYMLEDSFEGMYLQITTKQNLYINNAKETEIYFLDSSLQVNTEKQTDLIAYSQVATIAVS